MSFQIINVGVVANDGTGDSLRVGGQKVNANFAIAATTGSNTFIGDQIVTGSINVTGSITGSLLGTSSWAYSASNALNALSASFALTASYSTNITGEQYFIPVFNSQNTLVTSSIYESGSFIAIGTSSTLHPGAPERFLVDAGVTDSYNLISGHGEIDSYLQLNIKNFSNGPTASSDIVATANNGTEEINYVNLGINGDGYNDPNGIGGPTDAYLFSTGGDLLIGNAADGNNVIIFNGTGSSADSARVFITPQGSVAINTDDINPTNPEALVVGIKTALSNTADFSNLIVGKATINENYAQLNIINLGTGSGASADIVATNDAGTEEVNFIDVGINGSNYVDVGEVGGPNDAYVYSTGRHLLIGNASTGSDGNIYLFAGSSDAINNTVLFISSSKQVGIKTLLPEYTVDVSGSGRFTDGITASLFGTASWALSASVAPNYLPLTGGTINGDVIVNGTASIAFLNVTIESSSVIYSSGSNQFGDAPNDIQTLYGEVIIKTGSLTVTGSTVISGSLNAPEITGSLHGTASWANNATLALSANSATSASYASASTSASYASTSSFATTASFVLNAVSASYAATASYIGLAVSASYASSSTSASYASTSSFAATASFVQLAVSASYASSSTSASYASTSSFATTASFANNANLLDGLDSSIFATTGSNTFTGNQVITGSTNISGAVIAIGSVTATSFTGSLSGSVTGTASWANNAITASYVQLAVSASYASSSTSASYASTSSFATTASFANNANLLDGLDSTIFATTGSNVFTGTQTITGSTNISGTVTIVGSTTSTSFTGSLSGSVVGTASWANNAITASYVLQAVSASYASSSTSASFANISISSSYAATASVAPGYLPLTGGTINGNVVVTGTASIGFLNITIQSSSVIYSSGSNQLGDAPNDIQTLYGAVVIPTGSLTITGSTISTLGFTGSLLGTSSWANNATVALSANTATSASYASASTSASYSSTASFATTASYILQAVSASYASASTSASYASTSSFATTSSFANNANLLDGLDSSIFATTGSNTFTGTQTITGSTNVSGTVVVVGSTTSTSFTGSLSGSVVGTASWATNAITASYVLNAVSASYSLSSSYAVTASHALSAVSASYFSGTISNAVSSSYALSASYAATASYATVFNIGLSEFNPTSSTTSAGNTVVSSVNTGSFTSVFYNYTIASSSNARSGQIMTVWNQNTIRYTEVTTLDVGNTATASFSVNLTSTAVQLVFSAPGSWTVKTLGNLL